MKTFAPAIPRSEDRVVSQGVDELERAVGDISKQYPGPGRLTDVVTLGVAGTSHTINHGLGRKPLGIVPVPTYGAPKFSVASVTDKRITLASADVVDLVGSFSTGVAGAVSAQSSNHFAVAYGGSAGLYTFTLSGSAPSTILGADVLTDEATGDREWRLVSYASGVVTLEHRGPAGAAAFLLASAWVTLRFTGTSPQLRFWVF